LYREVATPRKMRLEDESALTSSKLSPMTRFNLLNLLPSFFLLFPGRFSNYVRACDSPDPSSGCIHMEIKEPSRPNISFAFDFKSGYSYGSSTNTVSAAYINGGSNKLISDAQGRPSDFEALHFEYDADGIHKIMHHEPKAGDQTFNFASGTKIFQVESKDDRGSWNRAIYTYNSSGDPSEIKFLGEENNVDGKKIAKEDITVSLVFYPDKPSIDKGNALVCWFFSNYIYAFYRDNFVFGQHLPKNITGTVHTTKFSTSGEASDAGSVTIENNYSYEFDGVGRPVAVKILSTIMGHPRPVRTFVISYSNCP